ncbi:ABC transporter permease subunit [Marinisporobacter balticus]|uniref:ABC-2 type transport system permease protein n=1 Tax=Marinisporobacter balticus TaxID=2018667 RepID=A0A4R2L3K4_9FIRM|nr:ABC transporter permease subunit [Marinisporobacter balticus]TCO79807.1 ABC-2 type transport system permease protein [Marinisporobacter balticus]
MNIFLHELNAYRKSIILWTISLAVIVIISFSLFPSFSRDIDQIKNLFEAFPKAIRIGMGISLDRFANILGYYSFPFSFVVLFGAIQAMNLGLSIVSKEVREKTVDFLLTKPIKRTQILTAKILAGIISLVITNVIYIAVTSIIASVVKRDDYSFKIFFMISITLLFVQLIFMSVGVIISVILPRIKSVLPISLATVFIFYFISFLSSITADDRIRYITPFKYFDAVYIIENSAYEMPFIIISLVIPVGAISASYVIYDKKDMHAV